MVRRWTLKRDRMRVTILRVIADCSVMPTRGFATRRSDNEATGSARQELASEVELRYFDSVPSKAFLRVRNLDVDDDGMIGSPAG